MKESIPPIWLCPKIPKLEESTEANVAIVTAQYESDIRQIADDLELQGKKVLFVDLDDTLLATRAWAASFLMGTPDESNAFAYEVDDMIYNGPAVDFRLGKMTVYDVGLAVSLIEDNPFDSQAEAISAVHGIFHKPEFYLEIPPFYHMMHTAREFAANGYTIVAITARGFLEEEWLRNHHNEPGPTAQWFSMLYEKEGEGFFPCAGVIIDGDKSTALEILDGIVAPGSIFIDDKLSTVLKAQHTIPPDNSNIRTIGFHQEFWDHYNDSKLITHTFRTTEELLTHLNWHEQEI